MHDMTAERGNKVYTIDESMKAQYQNDGYDIRDDNGEVIAYGAGKTVPYDEHMQAVKEVERPAEVMYGPAGGKDRSPEGTGNNQSGEEASK